MLSYEIPKKINHQVFYLRNEGGARHASEFKFLGRETPRKQILKFLQNSVNDANIRGLQTHTHKSP